MSMLKVHDWIQLLEYGKPSKVPENVNINEIFDYAYSRFGYFVRIDRAKRTATRFCPSCKR